MPRLMLRSMWCLGVAMQMMTLPGRPAAGQAGPPRFVHSILGVFDSASGLPLQGVQVTDGGTGEFALTTLTGTVSLAFVQFTSDSASIELRKLGYQPRQLRISHSDTALTVVMNPVIVLPASMTTERYRIDLDPGMRAGIADRCSSKLVSCFGADAIMKYPARTLFEIIGHADGVLAGGLMHTVDGRHRCVPTIYLNGLEYKGGLPALRDIGAVEIYRAEQPRPLRFSGNPFCGSIVVWTKD